MIRFYIHAYDKTRPSARRDSLSETIQITDRVKNASWMYSTSQPYEQATIRTTIRIDELNKLGLGVPIANSKKSALHCSGWLEVETREQGRAYVAGCRDHIDLVAHVDDSPV